VGRDQILETVPGEGTVSGQRFVEHARQRVHVDRRGGVLLVEPFRRHVIDGADGSPGGRQPGVAPGFGDAEVNEVGEIGLGDDDVVRLDVSMHQPLGMCRIQRSGNLPDDGNRPRRLQRPLPDQLV
jgi:hypothetical protein